MKQRDTYTKIKRGNKWFYFIPVEEYDRIERTFNDEMASSHKLSEENFHLKRLVMAYQELVGVSYRKDTDL